MPDGLRFEPGRLSFSRESVGALAHYYQCINMTVRPLLFHVIQKRLQAMGNGGCASEMEGGWKEGLSQTTVRMVDICIGAAQDTVNMMAIAAQRDMVGTWPSSCLRRSGRKRLLTGTATYGFMDGEHIFSATIVLVMVCAAMPANAATATAMNIGLSLLRSMGERGNSHMGARYRLLANLHAGVTPTSAPPLAPSAPTLAAHPSASPDSEAAPHEAMPQAAMLEMSADFNAGGGDGGGVSEALPFPAVNNSTLDEPFYDESTSTGMDFGLWEEGFAYPTMDLDLDLAQRTGAGGAAHDGSVVSVSLSDLMYSHVEGL